MGTPLLVSVDSDSKQLPASVLGTLDTRNATKYAPATRGGHLISPANFRRWQKATARVRMGAGDAKILCAGDSTTWGAGGDATNPPNGSYPKRIAEMGLGGINVAQGLAVPPSSIAGSTDTRWAYGAGWSQNGNGFGTASAFAGNTTAGSNSMTFTPGFNADTFDIYYIGLPDSGTVNIGIDTGTPVAMNTVLGTGVGKFTVTGSLAANHVLKFGNVTNGSVFIIGVEAFDSTRKQVRIANAGVGSTRTSDWAVNTPGYGSLSCIRAYAPDLTILNLGINDAYQNVSLTTWQTNLQAIIDACLVSGDLIIQTVVPSDAIGKPDIEAQFRDAAYTIAAAKNVGIVDVFGRFGSWSSANSLGFMTDALHPNALGYYDIASSVRSAIIAAS